MPGAAGHATSALTSIDPVGGREHRSAGARPPRPSGRRRPGAAANRAPSAPTRRRGVRWVRRAPGPGRRVASTRVSASRCRWPSDSPVPPDPTRVFQPSGSSARTSSKPVAAQACSRSTTSPMSSRFSSQGAGNEDRVLREPRHLRPPRGPVERTHGDARRPAPRPRSGSTRPRSACTAVDFPEPLGPVSTVTAPGSRVPVSPRGARPCRGPRRRRRRIRSRPGRVDHDRTVGGVDRDDRSSMTAKALLAAAIPSSAAWNWVPTIRSGRYTSGARISATIPASSSMPPYTSRSPMLTATSATHSVASSSSTIDDRNATRSADIVVRRWASPSSRTRARRSLFAAQRAERGQAGQEVEQLGRTVWSSRSASWRPCPW